MAPDQPSFVVGPLEVEQGETELLDGVEGPDPEQVLLERPDEALGAAVPFGRPDKGGRRGGAEPGDLLLEVVRHVLAPMIVADAEALSHILLHGSEVLDDALADRLERLMPGAAQRRMDADALSRAVINGDEDRDLPVLGDIGRGHVRAPHGVDGLWDNRAVVVAGPGGTAGSAR